MKHVIEISTILEASSKMYSYNSPGFDMTPAFWYSPTRFSKKLVLPSSEMLSMKSKGFSTFQRFGQPSSFNTIIKSNK